MVRGGSKSRSLGLFDFLDLLKINTNCLNSMPESLVFGNSLFLRFKNPIPEKER